MPKLNQIVAVVAGKKSDAEKQITELYHKVKKPQLFEGITKTYEAIEVNGEELPSEVKLLQFKVSEAISQFREFMGPVLDTTLTQDIANTRAGRCRGGRRDHPPQRPGHAPPLHREEADRHPDLPHRLPTLDPSQKWSYSRDTDCYVTAETWKYHTKKLPRVLEKAPATEKHPAQVEVVYEDKNVGKWKTINQSGAIPARDQHDMLAAREETDRGGQEGARTGELDRSREPARGRRDLRLRLRQAGLIPIRARPIVALPGRMGRNSAHRGWTKADERALRLNEDRRTEPAPTN